MTGIPLAKQPVLVQMDYGHPFTARGLSYAINPISKALVLVTQQPRRLE